MTVTVEHKGRKYTASSPYWGWKTDKGNIVTSQKLIKPLENISHQRTLKNQDHEQRHNPHN